MAKQVKTMIIPRPPKGPIGGKPKDIVVKITKTGCHECISHTQGTAGYPRAIFKGKVINLHRWVYSTFKGEIPYGMQIRHTCDNPICINKDHLLLGTTQDNTRDRDERNRTSKHEKHHLAKLTNAQVRKIKKLLKKGIPQNKIAKMFNVTQTNITCINVGKTWKGII